MESRPKVLVIEDDKDMLALVQQYLELNGFRTAGLENTRQFQTVLRSQNWDLVLMDLFMGDVTALDLIPDVVRNSPYSKIVVMSAFGSIDHAVEAMKLGAATFVQKTSDVQKIVDTVRQQFEAQKRAASWKNSSARGDSSGKANRPMLADLDNLTRPLIGTSSAVEKVKKHILLVSDSDAAVLIEGESGTGKEIVARAIHECSARSAAPFEAINCGAIPGNLLEAELFGYKKGAFTDARTDRPGLLTECRGGTVFLDEIAELPLDLQVKLLRVIQEREVKALGSSQSSSIDVRFVAATNENLQQKVQQGLFREDLFYRLSVLPMTLPPLRERKSDIPLLTRHFVNFFSERYAKEISPPSQEVLRELQDQPWPGNVRELQNGIERAVVLATNATLDPRNVFWLHSQGKAGTEGERFSAKPGAASTRSHPSSGYSKDETSTPSSADHSLVYAEAKANFERQFLHKLLEHTRGNVSEAARLSGRFRSDLYRLMTKYKLNSEPFREEKSASRENPPTKDHP